MAKTIGEGPPTAVIEARPGEAGGKSQSAGLDIEKVSLGP